MPFPFVLTFRQSGLNHDRISFGAGIGLPNLSAYTPDGSTFFQWLTGWTNNDRGDTTRKVICLVGILLHVPLNIFYVRLWVGFWFVLGVLSGLFNFWCVCIGFWWLDIMRGERWVMGRRVTRRHFDFIIAFLLVVYTFSFILTTITGLDSLVAIAFFYYWWWPLLGVADLLCPLAGWISTWEGTGAVTLA